MYVETSALSCGVAQAYHLNRIAKDAFRTIGANYLQDAAENERGSGWAFLQWSDTVGNKPGYRLAQLIEAKFPGTVKASKAKKNPNSRNFIRIWTWDIPQKEFQAYIRTTWPELKGNYYGY